MAEAPILPGTLNSSLLSGVYRMPEMIGQDGLLRLHDAQPQRRSLLAHAALRRHHRKPCTLKAAGYRHSRRSFNAAL